LWSGVALGAIGLSLLPVLSQPELVNLQGWSQIQRFLAASLRPDLSPDLLRLTGQATLTTLAYAVCGTCLCLLLGAIGGVLASEVWWSVVYLRQRPVIPTLMRLGLAIPRAIHELVWGLVLINLWGLDSLTAVLAIALPFGAITAKVFAEQLDETPRQPFLTLVHSGVAPFPAFVYGLLPLAGLNLLSYAFYRFECALRSAAVLGMIGAGGLGYEIFLSLQSLNYEQLWTFFYALICLTGSVDLASAWLRRRWGCASRLDLHLKRPRSAATKTSAVAVSPQAALLAIAGLTAMCFWRIQPDFSRLWAPTTWQRLGTLLAASWPPDRALLPQLGELAIETLAMSVLAIAIAAIGGALLAVPAAHTLLRPGGVLAGARRSWQAEIIPDLMLFGSRFVLLLGRAIPAPIWALVFLFGLFPGMLPGAIALGIHNLGILGRLKAEVIENLDDRPLEALKAQGASSSQIYLYGLLPLTAPQFLAYDLYRWEVCLRETVIVGLVGAGGLGQLLTEQLSSFDYPGLVVTLSSFILLTGIVDWLSAISRRTLR
jgi:phosphonate transport system permease protein